MTEKDPLDPAQTSLGLFHRLLRAYEEVVKAVYGKKIKDGKRLEQALKDDVWRYEELPTQLGGDRLVEASNNLDKAQVERLVQWKM